MATIAARRTSPPPERLRVMLTGARRAGLGWSTAWKLGRRAAVKGLSRRNDRADWNAVFTATERQWRAAYLRKSAPRPGWPLERPDD